MLKREKCNKYLILIISFKYKIHQLHSSLQISSFKNSNLLVSGNKVAPNYKKSNNKTSKSIELNIRTNNLLLEERNYLVLLTHLVQISILFNLTYHWKICWHRQISIRKIRLVCIHLPAVIRGAKILIQIYQTIHKVGLGIKEIQIFKVLSKHLLYQIHTIILQNWYKVIHFLKNLWLLFFKRDRSPILVEEKRLIELYHYLSEKLHKKDKKQSKNICNKNWQFPTKKYQRRS